MIEFSQKQQDLICAPYEHTLEVCEGSPRSGKTFAATARFALHVIASRDTNHLVVAYSAEQAYRLIFEGDGYGLNHIFRGSCRLSHDDEGAHLIVNCPNGTKKIYWNFWSMTPLRFLAIRKFTTMLFVIYAYQKK
jgi:hypothetical protein